MMFVIVKEIKGVPVLVDLETDGKVYLEFLSCDGGALFSIAERTHTNRFEWEHPPLGDLTIPMKVVANRTNYNLSELY